MKLLLFAILLICTLVRAEGNKCRALVLAGGGSLGAYEAAVFLGLVNNLPAEDVSYDVISGVSAGSLNALGLSAFEPSDVDEAAEFVYGLWNSIPMYNAYQNWPGGILEGLFFKQGIFDISSGYEWVSDQLGNLTVKRKVSFATIDANIIQYTILDYNATYTQPSDFIQSAFASASIPGVFVPVVRGNQTLVDGGTVINQDVDSAVRRCKEIVDDEKDIIVDMVLCVNHQIPYTSDIQKLSTLSNLMRGKEISSFYNGMHDYNSSTVNHPDVTFRYIIGPSESISSSYLPLDFSQKQVDICFEVGQKDAKNAVKLGSGGYGKVVLEYSRRLGNGENVNLAQMIEDAIGNLESPPNVVSQ